jgi:hypothetical protein
MLGAYLCMQIMHLLPSFWLGLALGPDRPGGGAGP